MCWRSWSITRGELLAAAEERNDAIAILVSVSGTDVPLAPHATAVSPQPDPDREPAIWKHSATASELAELPAAPGSAPHSDAEEAAAFDAAAKACWGRRRRQWGYEHSSPPNQFEVAADPASDSTNQRSAGSHFAPFFQFLWLSAKGSLAEVSRARLLDFTSGPCWGYASWWWDEAHRRGRKVSLHQRNNGVGRRTRSQELDVWCTRTLPGRKLRSGAKPQLCTEYFSSPPDHLRLIEQQRKFDRRNGRRESGKYVIWRISSVLSIFTSAWEQHHPSLLQRNQRWKRGPIVWEHGYTQRYEHHTFPISHPRQILQRDPRIQAWCTLAAEKSGSRTNQRSVPI